MQARTTIGRVVSWLAGGVAASALVIVSVALLGERTTSGKVDRLASDIANTLGDEPAPNGTDGAFAETDRLIAKLDRQTEEAKAYLDVSTGEIATVRDWRAASATAQVVRAEYWLRSAVGDKAEGITDDIMQSAASEITDCVNSSIRSLSGIDEDPAVVYGVKCIARLGG